MQVKELAKDFNIADEFVVEAMNHEGKFVVIGKVISKNALLNDNDLNTIWDLANWSVNGQTLEYIGNDIPVYANCKGMYDEGLLYVVMGGTGIVNDNMMVRKHYDTKNGYYLKSGRIHKDLKRDVWCYGSLEEITSEYRSNPFIYAR